MPIVLEIQEDNQNKKWGDGIQQIAGGENLGKNGV